MKRSRVQLLENIQALDSEDPKLKDFLPKKNYKNLEKLELSLNFFSLVAINNVISNPNLLPINLQTKFPLTLFGLTDYFSSYFTSLNIILPLIPLWRTPANGIHPFNGNFNFNGIVMRFGDLVRNATNNDGFNNYDFCLNIRNNSIGYGTILNNLADNVYLIENIKIVFNNANITQLENPLLFSKQSINGKIITDSIDLRMYVLPSSFQQTIVDIPLNIILDKNLMINQYVEFDCQNIQYIFTLLKIK